MSVIKLNLSAVAAESDGVDVLTEGVHRFKIDNAEVKETKKGGGFYISLNLSVVSGVDAGKRLVEFINVSNQNEDAQRIGLARLKKILEVSGHKNPNHLEDSSELIGLSFIGQTVNKEEEYNGKTFPKTSLYKVKDVENFEPMTSESAPAPVVKKEVKKESPVSAAAEAAPASAFPWMK